jgi:hypothetical protein
MYSDTDKYYVFMSIFASKFNTTFVFVFVKLIWIFTLSILIVVRIWILPLQVFNFSNMNGG